MKALSGQFDLFDLDPGYWETPRRVASARPARKRPNVAPGTEDDLVQLLEDTGRFKVLRKLVPRPIINRASSRFPRLAVLVDVETTGLNHARDEVIEIGAVAFNYDDAGMIGDVVGVFSALRQPSGPIPAEITRLAGITDEMVAGQSVDLGAIEALIEPADLVIAHNAGFDRPFCERLSPSFIPKPWACSVTEIRWADHGFEGNKLGYLVGQSGLFHDRHRATDDCHALLEILARPLAGSDVTPFAELYAASQRLRVQVWAKNSPFEMKDHLKARGYRCAATVDQRPGGPKSLGRISTTNFGFCAGTSIVGPKRSRSCNGFQQPIASKQRSFQVLTCRSLQIIFALI